MESRHSNALEQRHRIVPPRSFWTRMWGVKTKLPTKKQIDTWENEGGPAIDASFASLPQTPKYIPLYTKIWTVIRLYWRKVTLYFQ